MSKKIAVLLDTVSIQNYVFQSNKLKENLGASFLVKSIYGNYLEKIIREIFNNELQEGFKFDSWKTAEDKVEEPFDIGYIGGGNALLLFSDLKKARQFITDWTKLLLIETPGVVPAAAISEIELDEERFNSSKKEIFKFLKMNKSEYPAQTTLLRHGITAECNHTGLSAEKWEAKNREYISSVAYAKIAACEPAKEDIHKRYQTIIGYECCFTDMLDQLGQRSGDDSHIAVVHIDGNDMGENFKNIESLKELRRLSVRVEETTQGSFETLLQHIVNNYNEIMSFLGFSPDLPLGHEENWPPIEINISDDSLIQMREKNIPITIIEKIKALGDTENHFSIESFMEKLQKLIGRKDLLKYKAEILTSILKKILPIRSIILGGDDVTFVCDGKLGIYFAQIFMEEFQRLAPDLTLCGGVAIVKTKYPFYRAYQLAEDICAYAKRYRKDNNETCSFLDFHIAMGGFAGSLKKMREKYYKVPQGTLLMRPYKLIENDSDEQSYYSFLHNAFQLKETYPKNKLNEMRDVLTLTEQTTDRFMQEMNNRDRELLTLKAQNDFRKHMFVEIRPNEKKEKNTIFFDLIDISNFYPFKLHGVKSWKIIN